jgi:endonuclease YncB( thermonuclease family)
MLLWDVLSASPKDCAIKIFRAMIRFMRTCIVLAIAVTYSGAAAALPVCPDPPAKRNDCVHDGDTWWSDGVKYRHSEIDTPEISHSVECVEEFQAGLEARNRLAELMVDGFIVEATGKNDRYGRALATIQLTDGREAGEVLVAEGLAEKFGTASNWCSAN